MKPSKLILGTANLGSGYGITNSDNYNPSNALEIINYAVSRGIDTFDTAAEYGEAERLLRITLKSGKAAQLITKIPKLESYTFENVCHYLNQSIDRLGTPFLFGLLFHDPSIHERREIYEISERILNSGKVKRIGFSAYSLESLLTAKNNNPHWTIFQIPENILDRRLMNSTELLDLSNAGNIIHVRSIFLQGLLLANPQELPLKFLQYRQVFAQIESLAQEVGVRPLDICLSYAANISWSSGSIIAAATVAQLDEIINYQHTDFEFSNLRSLPEAVLDPRRGSETV